MTKPNRKKYIKAVQDYKEGIIGWDELYDNFINKATKSDKPIIYRWLKDRTPKY